MPGKSNVFTLLQTLFIVLSLIGAVEYFKYGTRVNYDWFHCTPEITEFPDSSIKQIISVGGPSCDKRGQTKSILKKLSREFDPNEEKVVVCLKDDGDKIVGYGANVKDQVSLSTYCSNLITW